MKKILIEALKIAFVAYTISIASPVNVLLAIILTIILSMLLPIHSTILLIPYILTKDYFALKVLSVIILFNFLINFFITRDKKLVIILTILESIINLSLFYFFNGYDLKYVVVLFLLSLVILSIFLFLIIVSDEGNRCYVTNVRLLEIMILSIIYSNLIITKDTSNMILIVIIFSYLRFIMNKYSFSFLSILNAVLYLLFIDKINSPIFILLTIVLFEPNPVAFIIYLLYIIFFYNFKKVDYLYLIIPPIFFYVLNYLKKIPSYTSHEKKTLEAFDTYLEVINDFLSKTSNANIIIENKIKFLYDNYCTVCTNNRSCLRKNKIDTYNYLYLCATYPTDLRKLNIPDNLKRFIINCPNYKEMFEIDKIDSLIINKTPIINHIKELTSCLKEELIKENDYSMYDKLHAYLIKLGYNITYYKIKIKDSLPEIYLKVENATVEKIITILTKQASFFLKENLCCVFKNDTACLYKKPKIKLNFEHHSMAKNNDYLSGDNFYIKKEYNYRYLFALSDGMGSGFNAFCQSKEMLNLVSNVSRLPLDLKTNISLINNVYQMKSNPENYATLDLLQIDCVTKEALLYKLGGTNTYFISGKTLKVLYNSNPPLGFSNSSESFKFKVNKGDIIIMLSDGVTEHLDTNELNEFLLTLYFKNTTRIVHEIIDFALSKQKNNLKDDLSALAIKIV